MGETLRVPGGKCDSSAGEGTLRAVVQGRKPTGELGEEGAGRGQSPRGKG